MRLLVVAVCATCVTVAFVLSGLYGFVPVGGAGLFIVNRFTGDGRLCAGSVCHDLAAPKPPPVLSSYIIGPSDPALATYDAAKAREAGHSLAEISDFLARRAGFDIEAARKDGVSDAAIINFLASGKRN